MSLDPRDLAPITEASEQAVDQLRHKLSTELDPADLKALLSTLPGPAEGAAERVRARLDAGPPPPPSLPRRLAGPTVLGALGAALLLALWPTPPELQAADLVDESLTVDHLQLVPQGAGRVDGTLEAPRITWEAGTLSATSRQPMDLVTREGHARGAGTLTVDRTASGTTFTARDGRFTVTCFADPDLELSSGGTHTCRPVSVDLSLARIRSLSTAPLDTQLEELERASTLAEGSGQARSELGVLHVLTLHGADRPAEALTLARDWLAGPHTLRRVEILRLATSLALQTEGCAGAKPLLDELAEHDAEALQLLEACADR